METFVKIKDINTKTQRHEEKNATLCLRVFVFKYLFCRQAMGKILILCLLFFSFVPLSAQVNKDITLTGATTGEIKARESITLAPDFETTNGDFIIAEDMYVAPVLKSTGGGDMNYIFTRTLRKEITDTSMISSLTMNDINQQVQYFDGLGRPIQTVGIGASPLKNDIVAHIVYDQFGREAEKHLPYPVEGSGQYQADAINNQKTWFATATDTRPAETRPFTEITFENSPLNRVLSQLGPGEVWKTADKTTDFKYETNTATEVILWEVDGTTCKYNNHYAAGELYKNTVTDENSNASTEYKDKQGQVLLKTGEEGTKTYYVYDDFGLLRFVIPPKAVEANGEANLKSDVLKNLCYYYEYDTRKRMTLKKLPGAGAVTMKYDLRDRLIETVDSMQRSRGEASFFTYDDLNRPIRNAIRYYNNKADTLTYTYYDNYDFISDNDLGIIYTDETGYTTNVTDKVKGRVTGTRTRILGTDKYISTVNYYDKYGRVVQTQTINQFGQKDISTSQYHFRGGVEKTMMRHHFDASNELAIEQKFQYDHAGRLKSTSESVNKKTPVITSQLAYDELGQLQSKKLHATASGHLQKTDYAYNIRGWLTGINSTFNSEENDLFGLNLYYTDTTAYGALKGAPQYNGNIRAMKWRHKNDVETGYAYQAYGFEYDKLNRLTSGKHGISNASGIFPAEYLNRYNEGNLKYDNNGNILNFSRTGGYMDVDDLRFGQMDSLKYKYIQNSNQLMSISDNTSVEGYGYNDVNKDTTDFAYDGNGNLTHYKDKKIKSIEYNFLNLPKKIIFDNADSIVYIYDAVGAKHIKKFFEKGKQKNAEYYVGGIVYETDSTELTAEKLRFVMNAEGRLVRLKNGSFRNEYFLKDHLGNTRVVFADTLGNGTLAVIQETNYYPFGLAFTGIDLKTEKNKFLYNGKELQTDADLGMFDYGARFYDPQIGRWHSIDPLCELNRKWSPYTYGKDNPLRFIDPNGMADQDIYGRNRFDENGMYIPELDRVPLSEFGTFAVQNEDRDKKDNKKDEKAKDGKDEKSKEKDEDEEHKEQLLFLIAIGLKVSEMPAEQLESLFHFFKECDKNLKLVAIDNNLPTEKIDALINKGGQYAKFFKTASVTFMITGALLDIGEASVAYYHKDYNKGNMALLNGAVGVGTFLIGGIPGIAIYVGYRLLFTPAPYIPSAAGYYTPLCVPDKTIYKPNQTY